MRETTGDDRTSEHPPTRDDAPEDETCTHDETCAPATLVRRALRRTILREWDLCVPDAAPHDLIRTAPTTAITGALAGHLRPLARARWGCVSIDCGYHQRWDLVAHRRSADPRDRLLCLQVALAGDGDWHALTRQATAAGYQSAVLLDLDLRAFPGEGFPITPRWRWLGQSSFSTVFEHRELGELLTAARERAGRIRASSGGSHHGDAHAASPARVVHLPREDSTLPVARSSQDGADALSVTSTPTVDRREAVSAAGHSR